MTTAQIKSATPRQDTHGAGVATLPVMQEWPSALKLYRCASRMGFNFEVLDVVETMAYLYHCMCAYPRHPAVKWLHEFACERQYHSFLHLQDPETPEQCMRTPLEEKLRAGIHLPCFSMSDTA